MVSELSASMINLSVCITGSIDRCIYKPFADVVDRLKGRVFELSRLMNIFRLICNYGIRMPWARLMLFFAAVFSVYNDMRLNIGNSWDDYKATTAKWADLSLLCHRKKTSVLSVSSKIGLFSARHRFIFPSFASILTCSKQSWKILIINRRKSSRVVS